MIGEDLRALCAVALLLGTGPGKADAKAQSWRFVVDAFTLQFMRQSWALQLAKKLG